MWGMTLFAAFLMLAAAMMLSAAWHFGPEVLVRQSQYAKLTARAQATIVDGWLALDVDVPTIRNPDFWRASTTATPCVVVELAGDWGGARSRAFCGTRLRFSASYDVPFLDTLAPGERFAWPRDARGFAAPQVRMSRVAHEWLASHPADTFMHSQWPAKTALEWLKLEVDRPVDLAVAGWVAPAPTIDVVYDPAHPDVLMPEGIVRARMSASPSWIAAPLLAIAGLAAWIAGVLLLPAAASFNRFGRALVIVLPLLALPWWADYMPRAIRFFNADVGEVAKEMMDDIDVLDRFAAIPPADAPFYADGERIAWRAGDAPYADTFGLMRFSRPAAPLASGDAAVRALAQGVTAQVQALPEDEQVTLLRNLARDKKRDLTGAGLAFVPYAREVLMRPDAPPALFKAASAFLWEWVTSPTIAIDEHLPGYEARRAIMRSLADVPVPEIRNMAR